MTERWRGIVLYDASRGYARRICHCSQCQFHSRDIREWRGQPLISHQAIVNLIAATTTRTGLLVKAALDIHAYDLAIKVTDEDLARVRITPHDFHGDWNYTMAPRR